MDTIISKVAIGIAVLTVCYGVIGTSGNVEELKQRAPEAIEERNWDIIRYDGYQFGSFNKHGGKVYYQVQEKENHNIRYNINIALWNDELQFYYDKPVVLSVVDVKIN